MARWEFKLPDVGEGITEGEIVSWLVAPGDLVTEDQPMVEVMTDKATVTIAAPKAGRVVETHGNVGEIVPIHTVLVVFELDADVPRPSVAPRREGSPADDSNGVSSGSQAQDAPAAAAYFNQKPLATPATRKFARDRSVDLRHVAPTGPQGRVVKRDVESFARLQLETPAARGQPEGAAANAVAPRAAGPVEVRRGANPPPASLEERIPFAGLRRRIAQKMALSTRTAAHFTFVEECDAGELKAMRARLTGPAADRGVKLSFLPFIVKATVAALKKHPMLNATLDESSNELVLRKYFHIGIATATDAGLVVPVVRDADRKSLLDIARDIDRLAADARTGKSKLEDLQGSTFTITSPGAQGGLLATPIINFPEVAILGVHRMKRKPIVKNEQIVIGDVMLLSLSFDHRIVDGLVGAAFAYEIIGYLEQPDRLMLDMA